MASTISDAQKQEIIDGYKRLLSEREQIASMVIERESEAEEHRLVASTLTKSDENKKAWRLVGDVLVEGTVGDVLVEVEKNHASLKGVVDNARQQLTRKGEEITAYEKKYNITIKDREPPAAARKEEEKKSGASGVLVK